MRNSGSLITFTPVARNTSLRTFDVSHDDHDEEAVVVGVVGVVNASSDLACADDFLQGHQHQLDGQEGHTFVEKVEGAVKDQVPVFGFVRKKRKQDVRWLKSDITKLLEIISINN